MAVRARDLGGTVIWADFSGRDVGISRANKVKDFCMGNAVLFKTQCSHEKLQWHS